MTVGVEILVLAEIKDQCVAVVGWKVVEVSGSETLRNIPFMMSGVNEKAFEPVYECGRNVQT